ncbi:Transcription initiation factor TFIID subunit 13 [Fulvia fulva]|uniref:Transcription initiation factor TFIID subunit 13 n=1 Tax=Passalora fulva TaxID=5499 RepID=A0A9Q8UW90_PASFU|nr:Transcription initiation factor TFIID subunit 13 [Fulvia fulva]KAK4610127.1 Transcription initiation factor TFIID subunit 13 [Fulvia fulva]KAK4610918.1 Transcription initiation factor TFIID subunit 13 [Fulvia fulva]UJO24657.1 Transcription initiation factor TFIID subunit 13 [Fulvia fulva]WPV22222.1 Transcription initiation factor TFIID subunit 13 [Fulvia fulva]WPV36784.1 Transcription initiation factor TFIID subunit 13 [Fulvia fulva]
MTEPRARPRPKDRTNFSDPDLRGLLYAFGDVSSGSLPETIRVLDEILTDFIIESCHIAATSASYSRRQKIKQDDFRWVLRHNGQMLGRVNEQLAREKVLKMQRKAIDFDGMAGKENAADLADLAEVGGAEEELKKKGRGRGRRKRKADGDAEGDATDAKKVKKSVA